MHIFFSAIGGAGIMPLALIAHQAGYEVSGSDKHTSEYITYLKNHGIKNIYIGQNLEDISKLNRKQPIDWYVYSSAVAIENPNSPEMKFCRENGIKMSKRDELLNLIITERKFKLIAIAGTHGKSTTTAMIVWLFKELGIPLSYSIGAKISFGETGEYDKKSEYFVYEADEFDRNFLSFEPYISVISGVSWDHHEIYPTREEYQKAFVDYISQSKSTILWQEDQLYLELEDSTSLIVENSQNLHINEIKLDGQYNRLDAYLAVRCLHQVTKEPLNKLISIINKFPGLKRRMEEIIPNLYSDYAHTPEKIQGGMSVALEMANKKHQEVIVVYEPLTDRRQHYIKNDYKNSFAGAKTVYWLPSYLAREDPNQSVISPEELISYLDDPSIAIPMERDGRLKEIIQKHLDQGEMVVGMNGGGSGSLDEWLRKEFTS
jgi:UDP-N-acetylmuramate--alanine ligase